MPLTLTHGRDKNWHYLRNGNLFGVSFQSIISLVALGSILAAPQLCGQKTPDRRSRISHLEVRRTELQRYLKGTGLIDRVRGHKVRIELQYGTVLSGRARKIVHSAGTSTLFLKVPGARNPEPIDLDRIETISFRGGTPKGGTAAVILVMLAGNIGGASMTQAGANLFYGSWIGAIALGLFFHMTRPHVVIRLVP